MGGGKGGGQPQTNWNAVAGQNAYNAAKRGGNLEDAIANQPKYADATRAGFSKWNNEQAQNNAMKKMMDGFKHQGNSGMDAYNKRMADNQAAQQAAAEQARIQGLTDRRDQLIAGYNEAANTATQYVTDKMSQEKANAALMGVDYNVTDDQKNERISNYFSSLWSEGAQSALDASFGEIGSGGFTQGIHRGKGTEGAGAGGQIGTEHAGGGIAPKAAKKQTALGTDDSLGGAATALGGA